MVRPAAKDVTPDTADTADTVEVIEQRVRRLENAVAAMQDTQLMEDRVVERVVHRIDHLPAPALHEMSGLILDANRMLPPKTIEALTGDGSASVEGVNGINTVAAAARSTWLLLDVFRDLRAMLRMLADYRYRMTWAARIVLVAAIVVVILSYLVINNIPFVGGILDRTVLVILAVVVYKVLAREVQRYHELLSRVYRYR